ncbi:MAG: LrgB family protein [Proteobacteria bacterium]|nr:LrgB family protein [Pseudomonadota bacterium]
MSQPHDLFHLWVYLAASPLLWLTVTIGVYLLAQRLSALSGYNPLVNPVLISIVTIVLLLLGTHTDYRVYFAGAQFVHFTLGPATVALGVPLYRNRHLVRQAALPILAALLVGAPTAMLSAVWIASALGAPLPLKLALIPKSVTAGIAMGIARQIGGDPTLTAVFVISTGIIGAIAVTPLMNALGIRDYAARGFAAGLASHGIGTARAFQVSDVAGAFAGLAMALNGLMTAVVAPLILALIHP